MPMLPSEFAHIFPVTTQVNPQGHLVIGGCDAVDLAQEFGTPLYVFDEETLRGKCREFRAEFSARYPDTLVIYAAKAYLGRALAQLLAQEGLGLDVVSGGELALAQGAGFPLEKVYFHGNNKGPEELRLALEGGVGRVVVDNFYELAQLNHLAGEMGRVQDILLRLSPGVDPHTHAHTTTGILDSKFGFPTATGQAEAAVAQAQEAPHLRLRGLHFHLGSPLFDLEPYGEAIEVVLAFAAEMKQRHGLELSEFSPGGGFAIQYVRDNPAPSVAAYAEAIVSALKEGLARWSFPKGRTRLIIEPGRAIVGQAGVALYRVGAQKDIPGLRRYVSLDGGMADNIRPAIYGARYEAMVANKAGWSFPEGEGEEVVTLAGKFCESGDIIIRDVSLPPVAAGDLVAIPTSGAYCLAMASNYNASLKPAIILVQGGQARLIRRRERYEDLWHHDLDLGVAHVGD